MLFTRRNMMAGVLACACYGPTIGTFAQTTISKEPFQILCGIGHKPAVKTINNLRSARPEAERIIQWISNLIGVRPEFEILEADFEYRNIAVAATRDDHRYVIYDAKWFTFEKNTVSWYSIWILAHEIGHHIYGHTHGFNPDQRQGELDADRFGGWVIARIGGKLDQALAFMPHLSEAGSKSHPSRNKRISAVREGWQAGIGAL